MASNIVHQHFSLLSKSSCNTKRFRVYAQQQNGVVEQQDKQKQTHHVPSLVESFSNLVHFHFDAPTQARPQYTDWDLVHRVNETTPVMYPKENIATKWRQIHGSADYEKILDPMHPWLRQEIIKYGEFAQATYDAFDFDSFSDYCGSCRYCCNNIFDKVGLGKTGYKVTSYIYAMSHVDFPQWLQRSHLVDTAWSKDSNWMGYVAVSDDEETWRIGRRDIVVAWRGTVAPSEWYEDLQRDLVPVRDGEEEIQVEHGFHHIYTSKRESTRYNKSSASEQVMKEVKRLVSLYRQKGEEVSLTITGHSLGGALALLNAHEAAESIPGLPISVISFGAPRVGNIAFKHKLEQLGVKTLRVVVNKDVVPTMPGMIFNEGLQKFDEIMGTHLVYTHVGAELRLDVTSSPYLKHGINFVGYHNLETHLHLVDGYVSANEPFRKDAQRDVTLVNKCCGMLIDELRIPECWHQFENKGLVRNAFGRWVKPSRDPVDVPTHHFHTETTCFTRNSLKNNSKSIVCSLKLTL